MKNILLTIIARFFSANLDSIISSLTKLDAKLDKLIDRMDDAYDSEMGNAAAALVRADQAKSEAKRAGRIQARVRDLTA